LLENVVFTEEVAVMEP